MFSRSFGSILTWAHCSLLAYTDLHILDSSLFTVAEISSSAARACSLGLGLLDCLLGSLCQGVVDDTG